MLQQLLYSQCYSCSLPYSAFLGVPLSTSASLPPSASASLFSFPLSNTLRLVSRALHLAPHFSSPLAPRPAHLASLLTVTRLRLTPSLARVS